MNNKDNNFQTMREAVGKKILSERDSVYACYLLTEILKKVLHESHGGGHFNINPDTVFVSYKDGEEVKVLLQNSEQTHESCNGKPDFDTESLNPCFRAPETFLGRFSPASDVYAVGMLLAYMLQGTYPYPIDETMSKREIMKVVKETEPQLSISTHLKTIIYKAIEKRVSGRFKNAEEMGKALVDYLGMEKKGMKDTYSSNEEPRLDLEMTVKVGDGFKAVAGMEDVKRMLRRDFVEIVAHRELAKEYGITPTNMLFYGIPGSGKTYISQRLAEESGLDVCYVRPSDLGSIWLHGSQGLIKELFRKAEEKAKKNKKGCILLIDEMDAVCGRRDARGNEHQADEVAEWLTQLNDCTEKNVFVVGTTNRLDAIDPAILRHGRLDNIVYIGLPDHDCRKQLFELELDKRPHDQDINTDELARITDGYTSSDISYMVKETAKKAFEACLMNEDMAVVNISEAMLRGVVKTTRPSVTREEVRKYERMQDEYVKSSKDKRPRIGFMASS